MLEYKINKNMCIVSRLKINYYIVRRLLFDDILMQ